jgi:hypothetical protein
VRVGIHTGTPLLAEEGYVGEDVHRAARIAAAGHGGQVIVSSSTAALLAPCDDKSQGHPLLDLGEHRLKDVAEAVPIFQLGEGRFPPLKTISNTNLPRPASSFVGRERELHEVLARIEEGARLLTLTGPGGSGKTRLALEAASTLVPEYKAGVFWVGLASLRDPALVTETIAQTLGAKDGLAEHISERELLLLLDNLEQVVEAAPELSSFSKAAPTSRCSSPPASSCGCRARSSTRCLRSKSPRRSPSSASALGSSPARRSPSFALAWTTSRSRSSWPRRARVSSPRPRSSSASPSAWTS